MCRLHMTISLSDARCSRKELQTEQEALCLPCRKMPRWRDMMDKSPSTKKGQMSSVDFLFASIIFVFILAFFTGFWYVTTGDLDNTIKRNRLEATAGVASDLLIKSPGGPSNWTEKTST